jgi:hypothetical protein
MAGGGAKYRKAEPSLEELLKSLNLMEDNNRGISVVKE